MGTTDQKLRCSTRNAQKARFGHRSAKSTSPERALTASGPANDRDERARAPRLSRRDRRGWHRGVVEQVVDQGLAGEAAVEAERVGAGQEVVVGGALKAPGELVDEGPGDAIDGAVEDAEAVLDELEWPHVVLEVAIARREHRRDKGLGRRNRTSGQALDANAPAACPRAQCGGGESYAIPARRPLAGWHARAH